MLAIGNVLSIFLQIVWKSEENPQSIPNPYQRTRDKGHKGYVTEFCQMGIQKKEVVKYDTVFPKKKKSHKSDPSKLVVNEN